ncbi:hypothetical protein T439DRAFT_381683 [Meredithblackwellia eburnea MCA 4105]
MSILRRTMRVMKLGKEKYYVGSDLEGNSFYQRPPGPEHDPTDWRQSKRTVEYAVARPLSEYRFYSIPVQWTAWMRRTRKEPPTIAELERDYVRRMRLDENVRRLEVEYREEKLRLERADRLGLGVDRLSLGRGVEERTLATREEEEEEERRREEEGSAGEMRNDVAVPTRARETEGEREKNMFRRQFAKEQEKQNRGTLDKNFQPESWVPGATTRRGEGGARPTA